MIKEVLHLPSMGLIYTPAIPTVYLRPFTTRDFKDFLVSGTENGPVSLVDSCLIDCPVKARHFHFADLLAALIKLRSITLGSILSTVDTCPSCSCKCNSEWDLDKLEVEYLDVDVYPFPIVLPDSGTEVTVSLLNEEISDRVSKLIDTQVVKRKVLRKDIAQDYTTTAYLNHPEISDVHMKVEWYKTLSLRDSMYIDFIIKKLSSFGVSTHRTIECPSCNLEFRSLFVSQTDNFFRLQFDSPSGLGSKTGTMEGYN